MKGLLGLAAGLLLITVAVSQAPDAALGAAPAPSPPAGTIIVVSSPESSPASPSSPAATGGTTTSSPEPSTTPPSPSAAATSPSPSLGVGGTTISSPEPSTASPSPSAASESPSPSPSPSSGSPSPSRSPSPPGRSRSPSPSPSPSRSPSPSPSRSASPSPSPSPSTGNITSSPEASNATSAGSVPPGNATAAGNNVSEPGPLPVIPVETSPGWRLARATYFGAPPEISLAYDPTRGEGSFGVLAYGSCGFTNSDGSIPFPRDAVAAAADADPDYPGSCGRCYAVRCKTGVVLDNDQQPLDIYAPYNTYLAGINNKVKDTFGRQWPGNPLESKRQQLTSCWNRSNSESGDTLVVRIIDSCPCKQVLPATAPGVKAGGETRYQHWCCGGVQHFDLSYWAFEQLAHPVYGQMMLEYKPVTCPANQKGGPVDPSTLNPLAFSPGFISKGVIYGGNGSEPGWSWFPYEVKEAFWKIPGAGVGPDDGATCLHPAPGGGLSFRCRECQTAGYQPFAGATGLEVVLRPNSNSTDPYFSSTPQDQIPPLKIYILNEEAKKYCNAEVFLNATKPTSVVSGPKDSSWYTFRIPLSRFRCDYPGAFPENITNVSLENANIRQAYFCLARLAILREPISGGEEASPSPSPSPSASPSNTTSSPESSPAPTNSSEGAATNSTQ